MSSTYANIVACLDRKPVSTKLPPKSSFVQSYGVACVRKNPDTGCYEVLMIKKRYTYLFIEFVRGLYDPYKDHDLEYMFDQMTITEKSLIQSRNFNTIWNYCNGEPSKSSERTKFNWAQRKYNTLVEREDGILLRLLSNTKNASLMWEIPKGRANKKKRLSYQRLESLRKRQVFLKILTGFCLTRTRLSTHS